jgi:DNA repair exonuclease SbcCD ATPase subunit
MTVSDQLERLLREIAELRFELERLQSFRPTPSQLNALPDKVREYIAQLHKVADAAEDDAALACARETIEALTKLNEELRRLLAEWFRLDLDGEPPDSLS